MNAVVVRIAASLVVVLAGAGGCSAGGSSDALLVGKDGTGGAGSVLNGDGGAVSFGVDAGKSRALTAHIEHDAIRIDVITLGCGAECADVVAVATGGNGPYTFAWEDGSTNPARHVCPTSATRYRVVATDSGIASGEFKRAPTAAEAPLTAAVLACPPDGGAPPAPCTTGSVVAGHYTGAYTCTNGIGGPVSFDLVVNESGPQTACDGGFCPDYVISPSSGGFTGIWAVAGFKGQLEGGLDCRTGEFHAPVAGCQWGLPLAPPPNDPNGPTTLLPVGGCHGGFDGVFTSGAPSRLSGKWILGPDGSNDCLGTFALERQ